MLRDVISGTPLLQEHLWSQGPDRFGDFWHYRALFATFHTDAFFNSAEKFAYPAPCALLYALIYSAGYYTHLWYDLLLWSVEIGSFLLLFRAWVAARLCWKPAAALVALIAVGSHPWHMLYDRGNIELFVYMLITPGLLAFLANRHKLAAALWGAAAALKLYPVLLLIVYLRRGREKNFVLGISVCVCVLLVSFWYVGPSIRIAAIGTLHGIHGFTQHYGGMARRDELPLDHSILASIKQLLTSRSKEIWIGQAGVQKGFYALLLVVLPVAYLRWFRHAPDLNKICILVCLMMSLPPVSYDYTLIYSYFVFGVVSTAYIRSFRIERPPRRHTWLLLPFALLTTPQTWVRVGPVEGNGIIKCLALMAIVVMLSVYQLGAVGLEEA